MTPARRRSGSGATRSWVIALLVAVAASACAGRQHQQPACSSDASIFILSAQAVPSATLIPCTLPLPGGWSHGGTQVRAGLVRFWLDSDRAGTPQLYVMNADGSDVRRISFGPGRYGSPAWGARGGRHPVNN